MAVPRNLIRPGRAQPAKRVTAVLGPTNTGKTYLAIERMMGHPSGMMGFPLRLLARENYDRVVRLKGDRCMRAIRRSLLRRPNLRRGRRAIPLNPSPPSRRCRP